jgi:hypothetical protein
MPPHKPQFELFGQYLWISSNWDISHRMLKARNQQHEDVMPNLFKTLLFHQHKWLSWVSQVRNTWFSVFRGLLSCLCSNSWLSKHLSLEFRANHKFHTSESLRFPLPSVSFHQYCTPNFIYTLLSSEGQTGEAWEPSKKQCSFGNREALDTNALLHCFILQPSQWDALNQDAVQNALITHAQLASFLRQSLSCRSGVSGCTMMFRHITSSLNIRK